jgi:hypothetical protein
VRTPLLAVALLTSVCLAGGACIIESPTPAEQPDAAPLPPPDAAPPPPDGTPECAPAVAAAISHHPVGYEYGQAGGLDGVGCLGQCHNGNNVGPTFTVGGSVWNRRLEGGQPVAGATVVVIDGAGKVIEMVTNSAGQFYTNKSVTLPLRTYASGCPDSIPMEANATGNCGTGACHGSNNKIYLTNVDPPL